MIDLSNDLALLRSSVRSQLAQVKAVGKTAAVPH